MYFSEEERKLQLTQKTINDDLFNIPWFEIGGFIGAFAMLVSFTIVFIVQTVERTFVKKIFDLETFCYFFLPLQWQMSSD